MVNNTETHGTIADAAAAAAAAAHPIQGQPTVIVLN